jgi:hypothetical protein
MSYRNSFIKITLLLCISIYLIITQYLTEKISRESNLIDNYSIRNRGTRDQDVQDNILRKLRYIVTYLFNYLFLIFI